MSRDYFIAGNWKMNKTPSEAVALAKEIIPIAKDSTTRVMIAPSFVCIPDVVKTVAGTNVVVAAQNICEEVSGAYTGETSVDMLKDLGVNMVILGHSERRHIYGETDEMINKKVKLALSKGMEVILCIGEKLEEREAGKAEAVCNSQIEKGLAGVSEADLKNIILAYEPVWAIGTGKTATPDDAEAVHKACRKKVEDLYSSAAADKMIIQYGGSVKPDNAKDLMSMENIDGGLIGGASLDAKSFEAIVNFYK